MYYTILYRHVCDHFSVTGLGTTQAHRSFTHISTCYIQFMGNIYARARTHTQINCTIIMLYTQQSNKQWNWMKIYMEISWKDFKQFLFRSLWFIRYLCLGIFHKRNYSNGNNKTLLLSTDDIDTSADTSPIYALCVSACVQRQAKTVQTKET